MQTWFQLSACEASKDGRNAPLSSKLTTPFSLLIIALTKGTHFFFLHSHSHSSSLSNKLLLFDLLERTPVCVVRPNPTLATASLQDLTNLKSHHLNHSILAQPHQTNAKHRKTGPTNHTQTSPSFLYQKRNKNLDPATPFPNAVFLKIPKDNLVLPPGQIETHRQQQQQPHSKERMPTAEATVLHGPLPSAHGNTASPTPRGGDEKMRSLHPSREHHHYQQQQQQRRDSQSSYYREQDKREGRSRRDEDREPARSSPASSSASFPYRDIIKSVLSVMTRSDLSALTSASAPAPSEKNQEKERERERDVKDKERNVEDVVRGLAMEEWNSRWLDELVAKVKGERKLMEEAIHIYELQLTRHI